MSDISKYGNSTLTESFGDSPEAQLYAKLPILNEELILENLKSRCDETITSVSQFPDPFLFKGMKEAVNLFIWAVRNQKRILCISDSDADGVGSLKGSIKELLWYFKNFLKILNIQM